MPLPVANSSIRALAFGEPGTLVRDHFRFYDADGELLQAVKITSYANLTILLDGAIVKPETEINIADIDAGKLRYFAPLSSPDEIQVSFKVKAGGNFSADFGTTTFLRELGTIPYIPASNLPAEYTERESIALFSNVTLDYTPNFEILTDTPAAIGTFGSTGPISLALQTGKTDTYDVSVTTTTASGSSTVVLATAVSKQDGNASLRVNFADGTTFDTANLVLHNITFTRADATPPSSLHFELIELAHEYPGYLPLTLTVVQVNDPVEEAATITPAGPGLEQGVTLQADVSALIDKDGPLTVLGYQWQRSGVDIPGATNKSYSSSQADFPNAEPSSSISYKVSVRAGQFTDEVLSESRTITNTQTPAISHLRFSGNAVLGRALTVTGTVDDPDGEALLTYVWRYAQTTATIATGKTYTPVSDDAGKVLEVVVTHTDLDSSVRSFTLQTSKVNTLHTGGVTISTPPLGFVQGEVLTASNTLADVNGIGPVSYQWFRGDTKIGGGPTYTLHQADVGFKVRVEGSFVDSAGGIESESSTETGPVLDGNVPANGNVTVDRLFESRTLRVNYFQLNDDDGYVSNSGNPIFLWYDSATATLQSSGRDLVLSPSDPDKTYFAKVTLTDNEGSTTEITSAPYEYKASNSLPTRLPTITLTTSTNGLPPYDPAPNPRQGVPLFAETAFVSDPDGAASNFRFQWMRDGASISGQTLPGYTPKQADVNHVLSVQVTYDDPFWSNVVTASTPGPVENGNVPATGGIEILGTTNRNQLLRIGTSGDFGDDDGIEQTGYTWKRDDGIVVGSSSVYALSDADVGHIIKVTVTIRDSDNQFTDFNASTLGTITGYNNNPGPLTITGSVIQGQTLAAYYSGISEPDGKPADISGYTFSWHRVNPLGPDPDAETLIQGAVSSNYLLTEKYIGFAISAHVQYVDNFGTRETVRQTTTSTVVDGNDPTTGFVQIGGNPFVGSLLEVTGELKDEDIEGPLPLHYQWLRNGVQIAGANSRQYVLVDADSGTSIGLQASYSDAFGLHSLSDADGLPASVSYQWVLVPNAQASSGTTLSNDSQLDLLLLSAADKALWLRLEVKYTDLSGFNESVSSAVYSVRDLMNRSPSFALQSNFGAIDTGPGQDGATAIAEDTGNGLLIAGVEEGVPQVINGVIESREPQVSVIRLDQQGRRDTNFSLSGSPVTSELGDQVSLYPLDDGFVLAGTRFTPAIKDKDGTITTPGFTSMFVSRIGSDGNAVAGFGNNGIAISGRGERLAEMLVFDNNTIMLAGYTDGANASDLVFQTFDLTSGEQVSRVAPSLSAGFEQPGGLVKASNNKVYAAVTLQVGNESDIALLAVDGGSAILERPGTMEFAKGVVEAGGMLYVGGSSLKTGGSEFMLASFTLAGIEPSGASAAGFDGGKRWRDRRGGNLAGARADFGQRENHDQRSPGRPC